MLRLKLNKRRIFAIATLIVISVAAGFVRYLTAGYSIKLPAGYQNGDVVTELGFSIREAGDKIDWSKRVLVERKPMPGDSVTILLTEVPKGYIHEDGEGDVKPVLLSTFQHGEMRIKEDLSKKLSNWRRNLGSPQNLNLSKAASKAISSLTQKGTFSDSFEIDVENGLAGYNITVTSIPAVPGAHVTVSLSPAFQYLATVPGL